MRIRADRFRGGPPSPVMEEGNRERERGFSCMFLKAETQCDIRMRWEKTGNWEHTEVETRKSGFFD